MLPVGSRERETGPNLTDRYLPTRVVTPVMDRVQSGGIIKITSISAQTGGQMDVPLKPLIPEKRNKVDAMISLAASVEPGDGLYHPFPASQIADHIFP